MIRVAVFVALALGGGVAAAATPPALVVRGDYQMGSFRVNMSLGDAQRIFGAPSKRSVTTAGICRMDWPGLVIQFTGCKRSSFFVRFVGENRRWRTAKGLAVGAPVSSIRKLYPHSKPTSLGAGRERWVLVARPKSMPTAFALTTNGRVAALVVSREHKVYFR